MRKVAIQVERQKRINLAQPDNVCTLFFWGFGIDEKLEERLSFHKQNASNPYDILTFPLNIKEDFEEKVFEQAIQKFNPEVKYKIVPEGREIKGVIPELIADAAKNLVSGLIPFADRYPMPFYRI